MLDQLAGYEGAIFSFNTLGILIVLVALEASLSADNAVVIATLVQDIEDPKHQRHALNWGLVLAFLLRIGLLLTATWIMQFWQVALAGALYLLWMAINYFFKKFTDSDDKISQNSELWQSSDSLWSIIPLIALTDLVFSGSSVKRDTLIWVLPSENDCKAYSVGQKLKPFQGRLSRLKLVPM